jgi:hypothetical protein
MDWGRRAIADDNTLIAFVPKSPSLNQFKVTSDLASFNEPGQQCQTLAKAQTGVPPGYRRFQRFFVLDASTVKARWTSQH